MEKTPKYEFGKPDQNDFYDVDVFNNNMEKVETAMTEFDDTGTVAEIKSFPEMLTKLVTGNKLAVTLESEGGSSVRTPCRINREQLRDG